MQTIQELRAAILGYQLCGGTLNQTIEDTVTSMASDNSTLSQPAWSILEDGVIQGYLLNGFNSSDGKTQFFIGKSGGGELDNLLCECVDNSHVIITTRVLLFETDQILKINKKNICVNLPFEIRVYQSETT